MMHFFDFALKNGRLNAFDITNDVRLPGGLAERYFGLFLLFEYDDTRSIPLSHGGVTTRKYYPEANQAKIENSKSFGFYLKYKTIILLLKLLKSITLIKISYADS
jgi:hypothetical protein